MKFFRGFDREVPNASCFKSLPGLLKNGFNKNLVQAGLKRKANDANKKFSVKKAKGVDKLHVVLSDDLEEVNLPEEVFNFNSVSVHCDIIYEEDNMCILQVFCEVPSTHITLDQDDIIKMLMNGGAVSAQGIDMTDLQKSRVNMKSFRASFSGVKYSDIEVIPLSFLSMNQEKVISINLSLIK